MSTHDRTRIQGAQKLKTTEPNTAVSSPEPTEIHSLLSNERRQHIIKYLAENQPCELRELAEHVATQCEGKPVSSIDEEYDRYRVSLYQTHLDALAEHDVIQFEDKQSEIRLGENAEQIVARMAGVTLDSGTQATGFFDQVFERFTNVLR